MRSLVLKTDCAPTLAPVLPSLGLDIQPCRTNAAMEALQEWRDRTAPPKRGVDYWLHALRSARGFDRVRVAWRAVWPSATRLSAVAGVDADSWASRLRYRAARLWKGFTSLPEAARGRAATRT